ncbi:MAG: hypothetical protein ACLP36_15225 [Acidimicrobiales bacterium]
MPRVGRLIVTVVLLAAVAGGVAFAGSNLSSQPVSVAYTAKPGEPVNVTMQTLGSYGQGIHSTWVSYMTRSPAGRWLHTTTWQVPAHTRVNVTIYQYDSGSPLRNQQVGIVQGTIGDVATLNGKVFTVINSNAGNGVAHTFSMPSLGINVPLYGNNPNANLCPAAPCTTAWPHNVVKFSFMSPGPGTYPWQCFVPCALGFLYGNGGPMQTVGWMDGFMDVVS